MPRGKGLGRGMGVGGGRGSGKGGQSQASGISGTQLLKEHNLVYILNERTEIMETGLPGYPYVLGEEFNAAIEYVRSSGIGTPKSLYIDLSVANNNLEFNITGNFFYVKETNADADNFDLKFNTSAEPNFNMQKMVGFYTPYHTFYITNDAQPGAFARIIYGSLARPFLDIIDNRSAGADIMADVLEELQGDLVPENMGVVAVNAAATEIVVANANRKSVIVTHRHDGVGFIDVGLTNAVTALVHCVRLAPGESYVVDDYRGAIWAIRSGAATNAVYGEV